MHNRTRKKIYVGHIPIVLLLLFNGNPILARIVRMMISIYRLLMCWNKKEKKRLNKNNIPNNN